MIYYPEMSDRLIHNYGCGILYLQRGSNKLNYEKVGHDNWFFKECLSNKIAFSIPWSVLEPEEGDFRWEHPDWEGCINSWIAKGFKVALQVRGMDTLGTFYNEGVPQWVFDAGAGYVDEPLDGYRNTFLLNNIPTDNNTPIRYPVYWDKVYLEKVENLVNAMGKRYNGNPNIEYIGIGHMGRWGEMHIADHGSLLPWLNAGLSIENYISAHKQIIDIYRNAFPDTALSQEIGAPAFGEGNNHDFIPLAMAEEILEYLAENHVTIKYNGLGKSWETSSSPYLCDSVLKLIKHYSPQTKVAMENLALPDALHTAIACGISYWHRGGESQGLGVTRIAQNIPIADKKIFSFYNFFRDDYDALTIEDQKNIWRNMARRCGYRLILKELEMDEVKPGLTFATHMKWYNSGSAPCYEPLTVRISLSLPGGPEIWFSEQLPAWTHATKIWGAGQLINDTIKWRLPAHITPGLYELHVGLRHITHGNSMINLANKSVDEKGTCKIGIVKCL